MKKVSQMIQKVKHTQNLIVPGAVALFPFITWLVFKTFETFIDTLIATGAVFILGVSIFYGIDMIRIMTKKESDR